jgi:hypothetical protein
MCELNNAELQTFQSDLHNACKRRARAVVSLTNRDMKKRGTQCRLKGSGIAKKRICEKRLYHVVFAAEHDGLRVMHVAVCSHNGIQQSDVRQDGFIYAGRETRNAGDSRILSSLQRQPNSQSKQKSSVRRQSRRAETISAHAPSASRIVVFLLREGHDGHRAPGRMPRALEQIVVVRRDDLLQ